MKSSQHTTTNTPTPWALSRKRRFSGAPGPGTGWVVVPWRTRMARSRKRPPLRCWPFWAPKILGPLLWLTYGSNPSECSKKKGEQTFCWTKQLPWKDAPTQTFFFFSITTFGSYRRARLRFVFPHAAFIQFLLDSRITMLPWMHRGMQVWRNWDVLIWKHQYLGGPKFSSQDLTDSASLILYQ